MTAFEAWKAERSRAWGSVPFEPAAETLAEIHERLVELLAPRPMEKWLDLATGTGRVAFLAAAAGAEVTGLDFAPELLATARETAASRRLDVRFDVGDCEALPYADSAFDVVSSSMGVMFAPDHEAAAREIARVCRAGGRIGIAAWTPDPEMDDAVGEYYPDGPEGAGSPDDWGREDGVNALLGDSFDLEYVYGDSPLVAESGDAIWKLLIGSVGTLKATAEGLDPERREQFRRAYVDYLERFRSDGCVRFPRKFMIALGVRH